MSYCRWSSMDWRCDVYVYESESGFETHVARRRSAKPIRLPDTPDDADLVEIGLPHDGESFTDPTPAECALTLSYLRGLGYVVPADVIAELTAEEA